MPIDDRHAWQNSIAEMSSRSGWWPLRGGFTYESLRAISPGTGHPSKGRFLPDFNDSTELLETLVGFPTVSRESNLPLIDWIQDYLSTLGFDCHRVTDRSGRKAGLFAALGPYGSGGVMLSAHSDVVPTEGQGWQTDPFQLTERDGRLFGRGASDMKGFLACALRVAERASQRSLTEPLKLAISWDEEVGCVGIAEMIGYLDATVGRPDLCIVGEPTGLKLITGHKGKSAHRVTFRGSGGHSSLAPRHVNALHMAADFLFEIRRQQEELDRSGLRDPDFDIPISTLHAGRLNGGTALNIVPDSATLDFELRSLAQEPADPILAALREAADRIATQARTRFDGAGIDFDALASYPGLDTDPDGSGVRRMQSLLGTEATGKVSFGTEAGVFARAGVESVVWGPGSIDVAHKADEYIDADQLAACDRVLDRLVDTLTDG